MALITCRECGHAVPEETTVCPHCGIDDPAGGSERATRTLPEASRRERAGLGRTVAWLGCLFLVLVIAALLALFWVG